MPSPRGSSRRRKRTGWLPNAGTHRRIGWMSVQPHLNQALAVDGSPAADRERTCPPGRHGEKCLPAPLQRKAARTGARSAATRSLGKRPRRKIVIRAPATNATAARRVLPQRSHRTSARDASSNAAPNRPQARPLNDRLGRHLRRISGSPPRASRPQPEANNGPGAAEIAADGAAETRHRPHRSRGAPSPLGAEAPVLCWRNSTELRLRSARMRPQLNRSPVSTVSTRPAMGGWDLPHPSKLGASMTPR